MHAAPGRTATAPGPWEEVRLAGTPAATGLRRTRADGTVWVVHRRRTRTGRHRLWTAMTDPGEVRRWAGEVRPDPGRGVVRFLFAFEGEDLLPVTCRVEELLPGRRLVVTMTGPSAEDPPERFELELREMPLVTELVVAQQVTSPEAVAHRASGCEFYLDRLLAVVEGRDPASLDFDDYFLGQAAHYERLFPSRRARSARG